MVSVTCVTIDWAVVSMILVDTNVCNISLFTGAINELSISVLPDETEDVLVALMPNMDISRHYYFFIWNKRI